MHLAAWLDQAHTHDVKVQATHRHAELDDLMDGIEDYLYHGQTNFGEVQKVVSRILKIEKFSTYAANREKKLANRYLNEAWSKRSRALEAYLEI
jgi:hypothetical protein